jgi:xanthine dehydrogenase accessory factor
METIYDALRQAIADEEPVATATLLALPDTHPGLKIGAKLLIRPDGQSQGDLGLADLNAAACEMALTLLAQGGNRSFETELSTGGQATLFVETFVPAPTLYIVGAVHIAVTLVSLAKVMGFRTVVIDARAAFATEERFAHADELIVAWPDEGLRGRLNASSYVAVLTHDPKLDDPAVMTALPSAARYVGALGSPSTAAKRAERLRAEGIGEELLARLHAPIGLKIGGKQPEEIALSIMAEIIKVRADQAAGKGAHA